MDTAAYVLARAWMARTMSEMESLYSIVDAIRGERARPVDQAARIYLGWITAKTEERNNADPTA